jgi:hypothetical protein
MDSASTIQLVENSSTISNSSFILNSELLATATWTSVGWRWLLREGPTTGLAMVCQPVLLAMHPTMIPGLIKAVYVRHVLKLQRDNELA